MTEWHPIETAPYDEEILVYSEKGMTGRFGWSKMYVCTTLEGEFFTEASGELCSEMENPTHWMPLPDPPKAKDMPIEDIVRTFIDELESSETFLRTERRNALGTWDTHNWGEAGKRAIIAEMKKKEREQKLDGSQEV